MGDLINRQAAIDLIQNAGKIGKLSCIDILKRLPSAQPDPDMLHLQKEQAYMQGWKDGQRVLREEMWEDERDRLD